MKILLINSDFGFLSEATVMPLTMYHISGILEEGGFETEVLDPLLYRAASSVDFLSILITKAKKYDAILFTVNTFSWCFVLDEIKQLRYNGFDGYIIVGGIHPSIAYEYIANSYADIIDFIFIGEAENSLVKLLLALEGNKEINQIPGLVYNKCNSLVINDRQLIDLSISDVMPSYNKVPFTSYLIYSFEASRGCRGCCAFCSITYKRCWRKYSDGHVLNKMSYLLAQIEEHNANKDILFTDDCFTTDPDRSAKLLSLFSSEFSLNRDYMIHFEARAIDLMNVSLLDALTKYNRFWIQIGVESGYSEGWKRIHKPVNDKILIDCCELLEQYGFHKNSFFSFIVGFPFETADDCFKTINTVYRLKEKYNINSSVSWWLPLPSECFNMLASSNRKVTYGMFDSTEWSNDTEIFFLTHPLINDEQYKKISAEIRRLNGVL